MLRESLDRKRRESIAARGGGVCLLREKEDKRSATVVQQVSARTVVLEVQDSLADRRTQNRDASRLVMMDEAKTNEFEDRLGGGGKSGKTA